MRGKETSMYRDSVQYLLSSRGSVASVSPDLKSQDSRQKRNRLTEALHDSMPVGARLHLVRRQHADELSDLVNLDAVSRERLMALRPLQTDEEVKEYETVRPSEDQGIDPHLRKRLVNLGLYHPGVKVMDFIVLYSTNGRTAGPMNRSAEEFCSESHGSIKVVPFAAYQHEFQQALGTLEAEETKKAEKKEAEPRRVGLSVQSGYGMLAAMSVSTPYEK